jgi:prolipoprotein diacylglyceryltransferase
VIGGVVGATLVAGLSDTPIVELGAGLALSAPWIQAIGRLRCLVQGCCHGRAANNAETGIRYNRSQSRVVRIAKLKGVPLYPTPLFSIYANAILGILLVRFAIAGLSASLILGVYFVVTGATRFTEEAFRGEPQTPIYCGIKLYQWLAIAMVIFGIIWTLIPSSALPSPSVIDGFQLAAAAVAGLLYAIAMGVDFPRSTRRWSSLTPDGT